MGTISGAGGRQIVMSSPPPCQTAELWTQELRRICESGSAADLLALCEKYRLKSKHLNAPLPGAFVHESFHEVKGTRQLEYEDARPLHEACMSENIEVVKALQDFGVDGIVVDSLGRTPFKCAVENGSGRCVNALRFRGVRGRGEYSRCQVFMPDQCGQTPFHVACELGYLSLVEFLWEQGSDINAAATTEVDHVSDGTTTTYKVCVTPLQLACIYAGRGPEYAAVVRKLLEWGADAKLRATSLIPECPYDGRTALEILSVNDDYRAARDELGLFRVESSSKRKRRTPVKERAVKAEVELPPTPAGLREQLSSDSPNTRKEAKRLMQRHQKACQQKVARAEEDAEGLHVRRNNNQLRIYHKL